jgi:putative ABC transport system permease protein
MRTLLQDIRYGVRVLRQNLGFTAVVTLTLALGMAATTVLFSVVNAVLLRPLPYPQSERLVRLWDRNEATGALFFSVSPPSYFDWREQSRAFEEMGAYREDGFNLAADGEPERVAGARVTASLLRVLGVSPALGRAFVEEEDSPGGARAVILTHGLWQARFGGDPSVVGRALVINGEPHTVVGVMPRGFVLPQQAQVRLLVPFALERDEQERGSHFLRVLARLKPGVTPEQARAEMGSIAQGLERQYPKTNEGFGVSLRTLHEATVGDVRTALLVLLGAVGMLLLVACANVANLLLARALGRQRELAIRASLGAGRWRLARLLLTEGVLLALLGGTLGLLLAVWSLDLLVAVSPAALPRSSEIAIDARVLAFSLAVSLAAGLFFGLFPALHSFRANLSGLLKSGGRSAGGRVGRRARNLLVVSEMALALVLLVGAGLLVRSFVGLQSVDPGFDPGGVLTAEVTPLQAKYPQGKQRAAFYRALLERVAALPGVESAAATHRLPLNGNSAFPLIVEGAAREGGNVPVINYRSVTPDYFRALAVPLLRGRLFNEQEAWETGAAVIINQSAAAKFFPGGDALGRRVATRAGGPWVEVVGIVADVREEGLGLDPQPALYLPYAQTPVPAMTLLVRAASDPQNLTAAVRSQVLQVDAGQPIANVRTLEQFLSEVSAQPRFNTTLLGVFALLALGLATVGVYGVVSYTVAQRTRELGIRVALGAQRRDILRLVLGHGLLLVLAGVGLGVAAAFMLTRFLSSLLFGVAATDPLTFVLTPLLLAAVALAASFIPARRATRVDPLVALRYE